jgi:hypothetical protein
MTGSEHLHQEFETLTAREAHRSAGLGCARTHPFAGVYTSGSDTGRQPFFLLDACEAMTDAVCC